MSTNDTTILEAHIKIRKDLESGSLKLNDKLEKMRVALLKLDLDYNFEVKAWYIAKVQKSKSTDIVYCECGRKVKESELGLCGFDYVKGASFISGKPHDPKGDSYLCPDIHCRYCIDE
tara:strand:+ start:894 stop:1247 length:354 start_codon:yes stop_codon:yes gene_type:complete